MDELRLYPPSDLGPDGYPPEWHATIKHAVRAEAGHRCVRCHHPYRNGEHGNGEWSACDESCTHVGPPLRIDGTICESHVSIGDFDAGEYVRDGFTVEARWRILTVHHLDRDKANCRWWNLAALCQRCHLTIQGRVVMERAFMFEHSERIEELLALERVA